MNSSDRAAELRKLIASCAEIAASIGDAQPDAEDAADLVVIQRNIEHQWRAFAALAAATFPRCVADENNPGYVKRDRALVPFYLLEDIPGMVELDELIDLGFRLRISDDGFICLSGSTALLGTLRFVGDIDYCEYTPHDTGSTDLIVGRIVKHATTSKPPLCERVKVVDGGWSKECPDEWDQGTVDVELRQLISEGAYRLKLDFVANTEVAGTVEVTNMALLVDETRADRIVMASFAAQEVPTTGSPLPRILADPLQLGRYLNFLIQQVDDHMQNAPVKALKRGLSLARIVLLPDWNDALIALLRDDRGALEAAIKARSQLLSRLKSRAHGDSERQSALVALSKSLEETIKGLEEERDLSQEGAVTSRDLADAWLAENVRPTLTALVDAANDLIAGT